MSDRKQANVADGLTIVWVIIAFVYCVITGRVDLFLIGSGGGLLAHFVARLVRRYKEKGK